MKTISKGYFLDKWFRISDVIHKRMMALFIDNGIETYDLTKLGKVNLAAYAEWQELYKKSTRVSHNICKVING